jgi:hypothetical protein
MLTTQVTRTLHTGQTNLRQMTRAKEKLKTVNDFKTKVEPYVQPLMNNRENKTIYKRTAMYYFTYHHR